MSGLREELVIGVHCGVHGRVAARLAEIGREQGVEIRITGKDRTVTCDSILEVLGLALVEGSRVTIQVRGEQAKSALAEIRTLLSGRES